MANNIIDSIRLSGTTYQIQGSGGGITVDPTLDSGSTNPVANSAITAALDDKVNVADNNASAYTFENKIGGAEYLYSEHFAGPIYIRYTGPTSSSGYYYAGSITYYTNEWGWEDFGLSFNLSDGQITATTVSSARFDIEIENGEAALTFKDGFYFRQYNSQNGFIALTKTTYESGQSADVIEDTVYDVFDKLNDKIGKTSDNVVTGSSMTFSNGYLESDLYTKNTNFYSSVKIDSSTIKSSNNGLSVQFETSEVGDKILNVGSGTYGQLFSTDSYDTSLNEFTITFNPNCTQYSVYNFSVRIMDASAAMYDTFFEYDSSDMSAVYTYLNTYCTVTDTLSTDYKLKVTAKEGYKIARLHNGNYMVGGVDNTNPNNYISNLVTAPSYVHDGQDVIDDIYDKLDDKQDTLVSSQNIKTINNESILGSGNINIQGGGKAIEAGRGISITTGETADTVSVSLPISAGTGTNSIIEGDGTNARGLDSHAEGDYTTAAGMYSHAEGSDTYALGESSHSEGDTTRANGDYSHTEGYYTKTNNQSEHASGHYNNSVSATTTFGDSGNTLFSVGNGTADNARHNAFEIRQNGDIYLTLDGQDVKLQDQLGGSSITVDTALDSGSTNPVANSAITTALDDKQDTLVSSQNIKTINNESLLGSGNIDIQGGSDINVVQTTGTSTTDVMSQNAVSTKLSGYVTTNTEQTISRRKIFTYSASEGKAIEFKQTSDSAKVGFSVKNSASTNNEVASFEFRPNTFTIDGVQHPLLYFGHYRNTYTANAGVPQTVIGFRQFDQKNGAAYHYLLPLPEKAKTPFGLRTSFKDYYAPMGFKNGSTMITADNTGVVDLSSELDGLKLKKLTQAEYDALATKDNSTLYVIVN